MCPHSSLVVTVIIECFYFKFETKFSSTIEIGQFRWARQFIDIYPNGAFRSNFGEHSPKPW